MATTMKPEPEGIESEKQDTDKKEKAIGGPDDLILLDSNDKPVAALSRKDAGLEGEQKPPFRLQHPKTQALYEQAGRDDQGRTTYRPS